MSSSTSNKNTTPLRIGMIGGGTVGGGVYEIIAGRINKTNNNDNNQRPIAITKICVRDISKPRDFQMSSETQLVSDVNSVLEDDDIELVVEVMGGTTIAKDVVWKALQNGKSVVTANKALIAEYLEEMDRLVNVEMEGKVRLGYEAAVCGGIPIIRTLQDCYAGDVINEIMGICNGTTNYMLGKMETGSDYAEVLAEAQALGYAEADPTADVEGHDVRAKIAILAKLAFGTAVPVSKIPCMGITQISTVDFEYAKLLGCTIKLVGCATRLSQYGEHDGALSVYVCPKVVPLSHPLSSARGSGNIVTISSANLGTSSYTGPGAGRFPTANSVVADICRIASDRCPSPFPLQTSKIELDPDYTSPFYVRISYQDGLGIIRNIGELAEKHGVSIHSVLQNPITNRMMADCVVTTEECRVGKVMAMCEDVAKEDWVRCKPLYMPLLMEF